jgi:membrane-bound acyltransferase YfiQ involved in biofilm formation
VPNQEHGRQELSLADATSHLLEECRMVLPGMQALFGFQLVVIFDSRFSEALSGLEQQVHLVATFFVVLAIALLMTPAAWHRLRHPRSVSDHFVRISSRFLLASMLPLAMAISLEVYIVARVILQQTAAALAIAAGSFGVFAVLWLVLPMMWKRDGS